MTDAISLRRAWDRLFAYFDYERAQGDITDATWDLLTDDLVTLKPVDE